MNRNSTLIQNQLRVLLSTWKRSISNLMVICMVLFALSANLRMIKSEVAYFHAGLIGHDEISQTENKLADVRRSLPPYGFLGYIDDTHSDRAYFFAQYALSPVILVKTRFRNTGRVVPAPRIYLVVRMNCDSVVTQEFSVSRPSVCIRDFGNGISLHAMEIP